MSKMICKRDMQEKLYSGSETGQNNKDICLSV